MSTTVLYVGGAGRSGSTVLERILGRVPGVVCIGELVHIWQRGVAEDQLCGCGRAFSACPFWRAVGEAAFGGWSSVDVDAMLRLHRAVDRNRYVPLMIASWLAPAYGRKLREYGEVLRRIYRAIEEVSGAEVVVDSSKHVSRAYLLRRVRGLDLRVVHLVRDSRGVAYSWTKKVEKPEVAQGGSLMPRYHPARMSGRWLSYNLGFDLLRALRVPSILLRYESLVSDPVREIRRVLSLVGREGAEPRSLSEAHIDLDVDHTVAGNPMRFRRGRLDLRLDDEWRRKLGKRERRLVSALTWPMLGRYGYGVRTGSGGTGDR